MNKIYTIKKYPSDSISKEIWDEIPAAAIDCYPWDENGYKPKAEAKVYVTDKEFHVRLRAYETAITAKCMNRNDIVCRDSCIEFFFNPDPDHGDRYINFEFNPIGTIYLSIGKSRYGRKFLDKKDWCSLNIQSSVIIENRLNFNQPYWEIEFVILFPLLEKKYGHIDFYPGKKMKGNFFKCGDDTLFPHYGCWNPIVCEKPDFHRPEFFGDLIIV